MSTYKTILIPTDFSRYADYAVAYAQMLAKGTEGAVHFVHVVDERYMDMISGMEGAYASSADTATSIESLIKHAEEQMRKLMHRADAMGLKASDHICRGRPSEEIVRVAEEIGADLIVMATHGRSGLDRLVLGSTCEKLIRRSTVPVLAIKHPSHDQIDTKADAMAFKNVLCPCDFSDFSHLAVPYAAELCRQFGAKLTLAHVVDTWLDYPEFTPSVEFANSPHLIEEAQKSLAKLAGEQEGLDVSVKVESGIPHRKLLDIVDEKDIDLLVMTTHGRSGIPHFLLGSITEKMIRMANCAVMTIRPKS